MAAAATLLAVITDMKFMTSTELSPRPAVPVGRNSAAIVWGASAALCIGTYLLSLNWLVAFAAVFFAFVLVPGGIAYGIVALSLTRKSKVAKWNLHEENTLERSPAAHFAAVPQVMTLLVTISLLLTIVITIIASFTSVALGDPDSAYRGSESLPFYAPLVTLSFLALGFGWPYHFSKSLRVQEAAAIEQNLPAGNRIRRARAFNRIMLWVFTLASILLLIYIIVSQIVTYLAVVNYTS